MHAFAPALVLIVASFGASTVRDHRLAQSSSSPPPASGRPAQSRAGVVIEALHRSGAVQRCWNAFVRQQPEAPSARFRVRVDVDAAGSVSGVAVLDPAPTLLTGCVRNELRHVTVPAGAAVSVETTYAFMAGATAPVPGS